jgi:Fur family transcriptional regulator, peroxide stress response regulator
VDDAARQRRLDELARICRERGLRCTVQRRAILEAVLELDNHPTAEQVYEVVLPRLPGVSKTTVYRTLESLSRLGVISKACHPGAAARFDGRTELHHHLICLSCDAVVDISDERLDALVVPDTSGFGFEVTDFKVQLRGHCRRCRERKRREEAT